MRAKSSRAKSRPEGTEMRLGELVLNEAKWTDDVCPGFILKSVWQADGIARHEVFFSGTTCGLAARIVRFVISRETGEIMSSSPIDLELVRSIEATRVISEQL